jgi:hypothetical protein
MSQKNQKNLKGAMEPLSLTQIKVAPLGVLQIQKRIIPSHQAELHAAVDEAMKAITRGFSAKAEYTGHVQMMNRDGTPVVGWLIDQMTVKPKNFVKKYRGKKVICEMPCCTVYHPVPRTILADAELTFGRSEPKQGDNDAWIKVESRSKRNRRLRSMKERKLQNEYLYSQDDEYIE